MNISEKTNIIGIEKTGCKRGHLAHCLATANMHDVEFYTYYGKHAQRGVVCFKTKNGEFTAEFTSRDNWLTKLNIL